MSRFDKYVLKLIAIPLMVSLIVATALLLLDEILRLFDFVLNENGPFYVVWEMLVTQLPDYLSLGLPFGLFLGTLTAFRRLSLSAELDVILGSGVSLWRLTVPVFGLAVVLMAVNFVFLGYLKPIGEYDLSRLRFEAQSGALGARIHVGEFVDLSDNLTLRVGGVQKETGALTDIFIDRCVEGHCVTVDAKSGTFVGAAQGNNVILRLSNGQQIEPVLQDGTSRIVKFDSFDLPVDLPSFDAFRDRGEIGKETTFPELWRELHHRASLAAEGYNSLRGEWHWRVLQVLSLLILPLGAIPLAMADRHRDSGLGSVIGTVMLILYIELLKAFEVRVAAGLISPWLSMWPLFLVFASAGAAMTYMTAERPGWRALSYVDAGWDWLEQRIPHLRRITLWRHA